MSKKKFNPTLFVWFPMGLSSGVGSGDMAWVHVLILILAVWFILEKLLRQSSLSEERMRLMTIEYLAGGVIAALLLIYLLVALLWPERF